MRSRLYESLSGSHIPTLDGIRGMSALVVVFAHLGLLPGQCGGLGVAFFFCLSGFLITWLLLKEDEQYDSVSLKAFYIRRALRIFPAFYVYWFITVGVALAQRRMIPLFEITSCFFYMGDYYYGLYPATTATLMGITWSLGIEEKFYLMWPFVFRRWRVNKPLLLRIGIGAIAAVWAYGVIVWLAVHPPRNYLRYAFESRLDNIMFGCVVAIAIQARMPWIDRVLGVIDTHKLLPVLLVPILPLSIYLQHEFGQGYHYLLGMTVESLVIILVIVLMVALSHERFWSVLDRPLMRYLGRISYSLYLFHPLGINLADRYFGMHGRFIQAGVALAISLIAASLSFQFIERRFLRMKEHFSSISSPKVAVAVG